MAQVKMSPDILSVHGRFGGVYFKHGPDGQHIQAMPRAVRKSKMLYPRTYGGNPKWSQAFGIIAWTGMTAFWMLGLLSFFGAAWAAYALVYLFIGKKGESKRISGYNWYMHYAMMFPEEDYFPFWKPPRAPNDLPYYYVVYRGRWQYEHTPPEWPAECPADFYWKGIPWNGKQSYKSDDYEWHIWWKDPVWCISRGPGWEEVGKTFYSPDDNIEGYYKNPVSKRLAHVYFGGHED